jgi:hypothetical protein
MRLHSSLKFIIPFCTLLLFQLAIFGCSKEPVSSLQIDPTYSSIRDKIFVGGGCATSSCHSNLSTRGGMVLEGDAAYDNLVGVVPDNLTAKNAGLLRVNPGKPDSSFLLIKLTGPREGEGERMPEDNDPLPEEAINAIRTWIANGAKRD